MTKTSVVSRGSFGFVALVGSQTRRTGRLLYKSNSGSLPGKAGASPIDLSAAKIHCKLAAVDHSFIRLALEFLGMPWTVFIHGSLHSTLSSRVTPIGGGSVPGSVADPK
jgi:hypothetical protein